MQGNARYMQKIENDMKENLGLEYDDAVWACIVTDNNGVYHDAPRTNFYGTIIFNPNIDMAKWERYMDMLDYSANSSNQCGKASYNVPVLNYPRASYKRGKNRKSKENLPVGFHVPALFVVGRCCKYCDERPFV